MKRLKSGNTDLWDVTLTNIAINIISDFTGVPTNPTENGIIKDLLKVRNSVSHGASKLKDDKFTAYFDDLTAILAKAGDDIAEIEAYKKELMELGQPIIIEKLLETNADEKNSKFFGLKEKADNLVKENKLYEAIEVYNKCLDVSGMSPENQALVYSNRSEVYLMLKNQNSLLMAKRDAEWTIQLWPCWWEGYYRLGCVLMELNDWIAAEKTLYKAFALNSESKEVRDKWSDTRKEIGALSRNDHLNPNLRPQSTQEQNEDLYMRHGLSPEQIENMEKLASKTQFADCFMAFKYLNGYKVKQDYKMAAKYYGKAAAQGIPDGMYNLALLHQDGKGVQRDYTFAVYWFKKAANSKPLSFCPIMLGSGIPDAQHSLGILYESGVGVLQDYYESVEWYQKAVNNGFGPSANNLGTLYRNGRGIEKSYLKAFYHFKMASQQGDTPGMRNLAEAYFNAQGTGSSIPTDEDIAEGIKWLGIAAEKGDLKAQLELDTHLKFSKDVHKFKAFTILMFPELIFPEINEIPRIIDQEHYGKYVQEAAEKGSKTAERQLQIWNYLGAAIAAFKDGDHEEIIYNLSKAIRINPEIVKVPIFLSPIVEKQFEIDPDDLYSITCYIKLNTIKMRENIEECLEKFQNDEYFLYIRIQGFLFKNDSQGALNLVKKSLEIYSQSLRFLHLHAIILAMINQQKDEIIEAFDKFLAVAPGDDENVPSCHYRKAMLYLLIQDYSKFMECFEAGIESEKKQLPCFLPYDFPRRDLLEKLYFHKKNELENREIPESLPGI